MRLPNQLEVRAKRRKALMIADGEENSARRSETAKFGAILLGKSAAGEGNRWKCAAGEANYWYLVM